MSANILSTEFFVRLASELASRAEYSGTVVDLDYTVATSVRRALGCDDRPIVLDAYPIALAKVQEWFDLNVQAVNELYAEQWQREDITKAKRSVHWPKWRPVELLKHLQCLHYQMAEGSVNDSAPHKELYSLIGQLAIDIVADTDAWDRADWGSLAA